MFQCVDQMMLHYGRNLKLLERNKSNISRQLMTINFLDQMETLQIVPEYQYQLLIFTFLNQLMMSNLNIFLVPK